MGKALVTKPAVAAADDADNEFEDAKSAGQTLSGDPHKIYVKCACDAMWITNTKTAHSPRKKPQDKMWLMVLQSTQLRNRSKACQVF